MTRKDNNDLKMGINWKYLDSLLYLQENLISDYSHFGRALKKLESYPLAKKQLITSLATFYLAVIGSFPNALEQDKETNLTKQMYQSLIFRPNIKDEQLNDMIIYIMEWNQVRGPFATFNEFAKPKDAWRKG